jgi:hypothetical protein
MLTPAETTIRLVVIEAGSDTPVPPGPTRVEIDRREAQPVRNTEAELDQTLALPSLRPWPVDLMSATSQLGTRRPEYATFRAPSTPQPLRG